MTCGRCAGNLQPQKCDYCMSSASSATKVLIVGEGSIKGYDVLSILGNMHHVPLQYSLLNTYCRH